jgi:ribosomal silencing factor RsfS
MQPALMELLLDTMHQMFLAVDLFIIQTAVVTMHVEALVDVVVLFMEQII